MLQSFWVLALTFLTVLTYVFVKLAPEGTWFGDVFLVRSLFLFGVLWTLAAVRRVPLATQNAGWHAFRSVFGVTALLLNIVTVQHLPIGTAQTLTFTAPLFVAAFSVIRSLLRGRPINIGLVASVLAGFAGICLTMRPSLDAAMTVFLRVGAFLRRAGRKHVVGAQKTRQSRRARGPHGVLFRLRLSGGVRRSLVRRV